MSDAQSFNEDAAVVAETLGSSLCPIYGRVNFGHPDFEASGVLVRIGERCFIFTAAHVVDRLEERSVVVGLNEEMGAIRGRVIRSVLPETGDRDDDNRDFAVFEVPSDAVTRAGARPVTLDMLDLDPVPGEDDIYLVLGLPATKQAKKIVDGGMEGFVYALLATALTPVVEKQSGHVVNLDLKVDRRDVYVAGERREAPHFRGMSGCGVFQLRHDRDGRLGARLSGIMIEHDKGQTRLRSTRPQLFIEALREVRPDVFEPSPLVRGESHD